MQQPYEHFDTIDIHLMGGLTADIVDDLAEELRQITPNVRSGLRYRSGVVNSLELFVGAAVAVYIGKAFTDAFLKELGTQAAKGLTNTLASVFRRAKSKNKRLMNAEDCRAAAAELEAAEAEQRKPDKSVLDAIGKPVPVLSITLVLRTEANPRFVFPHELDDAALTNAIAQLPEAMSSFLRRENERLKHAANQENTPALSDVYVYRSDTSAWIDARTELKAQLDAIRHSEDSHDKP